MTDRPDAAPPPDGDRWQGGPGWDGPTEPPTDAEYAATLEAMRRTAREVFGIPVCPTCGGSGQIPASGPGTKASLTMPCPACAAR